MSGINFSGLIQQQKDHLLDLANSSGLEQDESTNYLADVKNKLDNVYSTYSGSTGAQHTTNDILMKQNQVMDMVSSETERLNKKKVNIDNALESQKRMIALNDSYKMKYRYYLYIVLIIIGLILAYILIRFLSRYLVAVPGPVWDLILILVFVVGIMTIVYTYIDIRSRDTMNFNKLSYNAPKKEEATSDTKIFTGDDTNLDSSESEVCVGAACCSEGLVYDETLGQCVPQKDTFTNQNVANLVEPQPNEPSEFDKYTKYIK
tara:strand:- start:9923 stop:10708 length:786 start_codon:yes stop_codon:yes gene_type:complete